MHLQETSTTLPTLETLPVKADVTSDIARHKQLLPDAFNSRRGNNNYHKFGTPVEIERCINSCSGNGECQVLFRNTRENLNLLTSDDVIYVCICKPNFIGNVCNECREGYYGKNCLSCPKNPADDEV